LGNSLYRVRANILDVAAPPFKQKTRMDTMPPDDAVGPHWPRGQAQL